MDSKTPVCQVDGCNINVTVTSREKNKRVLCSIHKFGPYLCQTKEPHNCDHLVPAYVYNGYTILVCPLHYKILFKNQAPLTLGVRILRYNFSVSKENTYDVNPTSDEILHKCLTHENDHKSLYWLSCKYIPPECKITTPGHSITKKIGITPVGPNGYTDLKLNRLHYRTVKECLKQQYWPPRDTIEKNRKIMDGLKEYLISDVIHVVMGYIEFGHVAPIDYIKINTIVCLIIDTYLPTHVINIVINYIFSN